jgi:aminoglycoside phosphotransferase
MGGDQVVKLSDDIAAKFGFGVFASEAAMQEFAYNTVDRKLVRVPKVYRYFESETDDPFGYLFMEHIPGQILGEVDLEERKDILPRIANIITHLGQIKSPTPGPIDESEPFGYVWGDYGARTAFYSVEDLNVYMNSRLEYRNDTIDLTPHPFVLCHGDICRRNIICGNDGSICFLDWAYAGFYPRFFELATISCVLPYDEDLKNP